MKKYLLVSLCVMAASCSGTQTEVSVTDRFPSEETNSFYVSNREPLNRQQLIKLPTGSIRPGGWLMRQLELQKDGLNGHLGEISAWLQKENNAWLSKGGEWGWEEVPYWLRGYASLSYIMQDEAMLKETRFWIDGILNSQQENGNFGPAQASKRSPKGTQDFWPNMIALWILQDYYEYSADERVIPFMLRYCNFMLSVPDDKFQASYWENSRGGDNLWSVVWLYNRTGEPKLLELAEKIHRCTADWTRSTQLPNWHNVNIAQCFREPATYFLFSKDSSMLKASYNVQSLVRRAFGQVPGGMFGADENARIGFFDPRQATETCGFAEQMASDEIMLLITGDPVWAENCEDVAFNSYPASLMPDYKALRYLTAPNQTVSDAVNHSPGINNKGPFLAMNPFSSRCCQHNHGFAWPYYSQYLVMATPDNGAAVALYSDCTAKVKVGEGTEIILREETCYPFEENIRFTIESHAQDKFPLYFRIPSWCAKAEARINGKRVAAELTPGKYLRLERSWSNGDIITLNFPMSISMRTWQVNKNSVSVDYGPLTLSLEIGEEYRKADSHKVALKSSKWQEGADPEEWPSYEIFATTPWNYALAVDAPITVEHREWPADNNPFTAENTPLKFHAKGRIVPEWGFDEYGLTGVLPYEDAPKAAQVDNITLIPMGAARLRISAFPTCTE